MLQHPMLPAMGPQTIMEAGDWAHSSTTYGHYIRFLHREVLARIIKQTSGSIHGVNVAVIATNNPLWWDGVMQPSPIYIPLGRGLPRRTH